MKKYSNNIKYILLSLITIFFFLWNISLWDSDDPTNDLMYQVFEASMDYWGVFRIWRTSSDVWKELLRWWTWFSAWESWTPICMDDTTKEILYIYEDWKRKIIKNKSDCDLAGWNRHPDPVELSYKYPLIVKVTKILLRITIILAITMIIFSSVKLMASVLGWKDLKSSDAKKDIIGIVVWLLLALFSVTIINLVISIPNKSLQTSNDITIWSN